MQEDKDFLQCYSMQQKNNKYSLEQKNTSWAITKQNLFGVCLIYEGFCPMFYPQCQVRRPLTPPPKVAAAVRATENEKSLTKTSNY